MNRVIGLLIAGALVAGACGSGDEGALTEAGGAEATDVADVAIDVDVSTTVSLPTTIVFESTTTMPPDLASTSTSALTGSTATRAVTTTAPPSTLAAAACSDGPVPDGEDTPSVSLDVDGDGTNETVYASFFDPVWMVVAEFADGRYVALAIVEAHELDPVRVVGGARFIGDKTDDIIVALGGGAYTTSVGFIRYSDCDMERLTFEDGHPATFLSGASIGNFSGVYCSTGLVEQYFFEISGEDDEGAPIYDGGFTPYNLEGTTFVEFPSDGTVLTLDELGAIDTFSCFGNSL